MADHERERDQSEAELNYKVSDRRLFTPDGELREELVEDEEEPARADTQATAERRAESAAAERGFERRSIEEPEGVDFTMLINAMAEPALLFLGEIPHPATGEARVDLERARLQIDMLDLLRVKCRGNLTAAEESLLDRILYQLRMLYVSRANQPTS
jgi:hypothetical protein